MKKFFKLIRSKMINAKIYIARTMSWVSIMNSLMLVFLVIERLSSLGVIKGDLGNSLIFVILIWFCLLVFLGWIEVKKIKFPQTESVKMLELNPPMKNAFIKIDNINKKMDIIEEELKKLSKNE